ncbi:MAG TPA: TonB-dependent receptor [Steroidobacteraceae bacterium]
MPVAHAQQQAAAEASPGLEEVVVTAQKRTENLQDVPLSIQAIGTQQLEQMNVTNFNDYAKLLPSVSFQDSGPSFEHVYMRGVASGGDGNHSGSQPSVGMYLDEQPVTTIDGNLPIHIYDIARVEALSGPQGTLYGASSESGTIRIITNKPDPTAVKAGYDLEGNSVDHGGIGYTAEGFVNLPLGSNAAVRLVAWDEKKAGYIDNIHGTVTFPTSNITLDNAKQVQNNYNTVEDKGGRAALKVNLNDNWSITPQIMGQVMQTDGDFGYNPKLGDLDTLKFYPELAHDSWVQSALTIEGKISNFDLVYAGAYLTRNTHENEDYTDYSLYYDTAYAPGYGQSIVGNAGNMINPAQYIIGRDHYTKTSNELRVSSPKDYPFRFTAGLFLERQVHEILQDYNVNYGTAYGPLDPLATDLSVAGWPGSIWLTDQERVDRDAAVFGEFAYDITKALTANIGIRHYTYDNTLQGFYGFGAGYDPNEGVGTCFNSVPFHGAPCSDLNGRSTGSGNLPKYNLTYKVDRDRMLYATLSKGFRPGGVNRNGGGTLPPYQADFLTNVELGWKTTWLDNRFRWNGAVFRDKWNNFQFSYLGANALTVIANAGQAEIKGLESDLEFAVSEGLTLSGGFTWLDAKLTQTFGTPGVELYAPNGTQLPVTPKFKGNLTARYQFSVGNDVRPYVQASEVYVGSRTADLRQVAAQALGVEPAYALTDLAAGMEWNKMTAELYVSNTFDRRAVLDRFAECDVATCGAVAIYDVPNQPRTIGIRFGQRF